MPEWLQIVTAVVAAVCFILGAYHGATWYDHRKLHKAVEKYLKEHV